MVELIKKISPEEARDILETANPRSEYYLRNLVATYLGPDIAEKADYNELRKHWWALHGVAEKEAGAEQRKSGCELTKEKQLLLFQ